MVVDPQTVCAAAKEDPHARVHESQREPAEWGLWEEHPGEVEERVLTSQS